MRSRPLRDLPGPALSDVTSPAAWGSVVTPLVDEPHPRRTGRNRELDVYTALAVVASVVFTVYQFCNVDNELYRGTPARDLLASLDAAVPWFFVLIGYRVFRPAVSAYLDGAPTAPARTLLARQAIAIVPAYYVVITVVWFCRQQSLPGDWRDLLEHLTFTQVFDPKRIFYTDGPAWAVSVTVAFLLIMAIVNTGLARFAGGPTRRQRLVLLSAPTAALAGISLAWKAWSLLGAHQSTAASSTTWYGPLANLDNFAMGMAVAVFLAARPGTNWSAPGRPKYRLGLRVAAAVVLAAAVVTRHAGSWSAAFYPTICSIAFACLIAAAALAARAQQPRRVERHRFTTRRFEPGVTWFSRIAVIAYGTYLWREPVLLALNGWGGVVVQTPDAFVRDTAVVLAVSLVVGSLSYLAIERPALQLYRLANHGRRPDDAPVLPTPSIRLVRTASAAPGRPGSVGDWSSR